MGGRRLNSVCATHISIYTLTACIDNTVAEPCNSVRLCSAVKRENEDLTDSI